MKVLSIIIIFFLYVAGFPRQLNVMDRMTVIDTIPPVVSLISPVDSNMYRASGIPIFITATDNSGIASVEYYMDGYLIELLASPYESTLRTDPGIHTLFARAIDFSGNVSVTNIIAINAVADGIPIISADRIVITQDSSVVLTESYSPDTTIIHYFKLIYSLPGQSTLKVSGEGLLVRVKKWTNEYSYVIEFYNTAWKKINPKNFKAFSGQEVIDLFEGQLPFNDTIFCNKIRYTTSDTIVRTKTLNYLVMNIVNNEPEYKGNDGVVYDVYDAIVRGTATWSYLPGNRWMKL